MKTIRISTYFHFGQIFRFLANVNVPLPLKGEKKVLWNIKQLLKYIDEFGLSVSKRASDKLGKLKLEWQKFPKDHILNDVELKQLRTLLVKLEPTIIAETGGKFAYIVSEKRMDTNKLLNDTPSLFRKDVFNLLPDIAQFDFRQAGKCVAFEFHTAGAFHLLRGTEAVLRFFYCKIVKRKRVSPPNWGPIVSHLGRRRDPPPKELLQNLDNLRDSFRNPTQHPEKIYDTDEVQDLFGLCVDIVNRMILYLADKKLYKASQGSS